MTKLRRVELKGSNIRVDLTIRSVEVEGGAKKGASVYDFLRFCNFMGCILDFQGFVFVSLFKPF